MTPDELHEHLRHLKSWVGPDTDPTAKEYFRKEMAKRSYGRDETISAWEHFYEGWQAHDDTVY
jgi:hypothetical protein